jgi:hypothetical protein
MPAPSAPTTCYDWFTDSDRTNILSLWLMAPHLEMFYNNGMISDADANAWATYWFPVCGATSSSSQPDIACLSAALASIDPYCAVCDSSTSSACHYPPAFVYTPGGMTGTDLYCPAGVTADNINRFHSLGYLIDEPAFYNLGPWDAIPDTVLTQADIAEILTIYPHCATDPAGQNPCLMGEFTRIRHELMTCVIDPNMGGTGSGYTGTGNYCPYNVLPEQMGLYHSLSTITVDMNLFAQ